MVIMKDFFEKNMTLKKEKSAPKNNTNWASLRVISMHFRVFLKGQGTELGFFFGLLKFQIFFGVLEIPDIFFLE